MDINEKEAYDKSYGDKSMPLSKFIKLVVILIILGVGIYFAWNPIHDFFAQINPKNPQAPENIAGNLGLAVDQTAAGLTGQTQVGALQRVKVKITDADLSTIRNALELYRMDHNGQLPSDLNELVKSGALSGNTPLKDPWGTDYDSKVVGDKFYIISAGPDKVKGTDDDQTIDITAPLTPQS